MIKLEDKAMILMKYFIEGQYERTGNGDLYWAKFHDYLNTLREYYDTLSEEERKGILLADEILALSLKYVMYCSPAKYVDQASDLLTEKIPEGSENFMHVKDSFYTKAKEEGREEGIKKGKKLESLEVVVELLERKLKSSLSEKLIRGLESSTYSQLKLLRLNIFEIESEEDVFKILEK